MEKHIQDGVELETDESQQIPIDPFPLPFVPNPLLSNQLLGNNSPLLSNGLSSHFPYHFPLSYQMTEQLQQQQELMQQDQQLQIFWANQLQEIKATTDFKNHNLPLARIKKIMKSDEDVKMIAAETPVLFSRACEMFILELTYRSWSQAEHNKRRTLQKSDICSAIAKYPMFDFLIDIVPKEEEKDTRVPMDVGNDELNESIHCYYEPSRLGSLMMDMRLPEKVPHSLSFANQHQEYNVQENANNSTPNESE